VPCGCQQCCFGGFLDATQTGVGGPLAVAAFLLIAITLLLPRVLGIFHTTTRTSANRWRVAGAALTETLFSSLYAPSLMMQRVMIIGGVLANRRIGWAAHEKANRSFPDYFMFHMAEVLAGLGVLAVVERGVLSFWFLPLAVCLVFAPVLSWVSAWPYQQEAHEKLNATTSF
jgi:membrane glycosyltransferase